MALGRIGVYRWRWRYRSRRYWLCWPKQVLLPQLRLWLHFGAPVSTSHRPSPWSIICRIRLSSQLRASVARAIIAAYRRCQPLWHWWIYCLPDQLCSWHNLRSPVLVEPEILQHGNIGRTCSGKGTHLHLGPGFRLMTKAPQTSGMGSLASLTVSPTKTGITLKNGLAQDYAPAGDVAHDAVPHFIWRHLRRKPVSAALPY